jgi:hypothetical protein
MYREKVARVAVDFLYLYTRLVYLSSESADVYMDDQINKACHREKVGALVVN